MYHDDKAYQKSVFIALGWTQKLQDTLPSVTQKLKERLGVQIEAEFLSLGSFNSCYRLKGAHSILRFPILSKSAFRYEKTNDECSVMAYISRNTSIPIPKLLAVESCDVGPYLVMSFEEGSLLSDNLRESSKLETPMVLNPNIDAGSLIQAYRNMARIMIELSDCKFSKIGAIGRDESRRWSVTKRPITLNMNQLVSCGNFPANLLSRKTFSTANEYFTSLAEMHLIHLKTQRNDAIDDEADCRKKYIARHLFLNIARNFSTANNRGPFPLYCDDLRPSNVVVDSNGATRAVIDWEYCYAAPAEFTYCSPWWLLLRHPEDWENGNLDDFLHQYLPRQKVFLEALRKEEDGLARQRSRSSDSTLSGAMAESLGNGHFWFCLAATSSFGFDDIYWRYLDPIYHGPFTTLEDRLQLLGQEERNNLDSFVKLKEQQAREDKLDEHRTFHEMFIA